MSGCWHEGTSTDGSKLKEYILLVSSSVSSRPPIMNKIFPGSLEHDSPQQLSLPTSTPSSVVHFLVLPLHPGSGLDVQGSHSLQETIIHKSHVNVLVSILLGVGSPTRFAIFTGYFETELYPGSTKKRSGDEQTFFVLNKKTISGSDPRVAAPIFPCLTYVTWTQRSLCSVCISNKSPPEV